MKAIVLVLLVMSCGEVQAGRQAKLCKQQCGAAIAACINGGGHNKKCAAKLHRQCVRRGLGACATTTTTTSSSTTTTTAPPGRVFLFIEPGTGCPFTTDDGRDICFFGAEMSGDGNVRIDLDRNHFSLVADDGRTYAADEITDSHACTTSRVLLPNGANTCLLRFTLPPAVQSALLTFDGAGYHAEDAWSR